MPCKTLILRIPPTLIILLLIINYTLGGVSNFASASNQDPTIEEITKAGNEAIIMGDWAKAESQFREAIRLAPTQGFWRIQLVLVLGQQKKWKDAFAEMEPLLKNRAVDWILTVDAKLPDGGVAFVNTEKFGDQEHGILRYVEAVKEKKNVESVARDIGIKLDAFAKQHKIALMYDSSKFKSLPFESGNTADLTKEFINFYNGSEYVSQYYGNVYIYRGDDTPYYGGQVIVRSTDAIVYLDGEEFLSLPERTFIGFKVPIGRYVLQMQWKNIHRVLDVEANKNYYLRVEQATYPNVYQMIADVDEKGATEAIRKSYMLSEKKIKLKRFEIIKTKPSSK